MQPMAVRLFVAGLPPDTTLDLLQQRLAPFGAITACSLNAGKGFAHLDLAPRDSKAADRCITTVRAAMLLAWRMARPDPTSDPGGVQYNGTSWRGSRLRVERAKPDELEQYAREREEGGPAVAAPAHSLPGQPTVGPTQPLHLVHPGTLQVRGRMAGRVLGCI